MDRRKMITVDEKLINEYLAQNQKEHYVHKYNYGQVLVIAGSKGMEGANILAATGSLYSGAGIVVTMYMSDSDPHLFSPTPELMIRNIDDLNQEFLQKFAVIIFGCGVAINNENKFILQFLLEYKAAHTALIIDGGGLGLLKQISKWYENENIILTPHYGEFKDLFPTENNNFHDVASFIVSEHPNLKIVLKGEQTVIYFHEKVYLNIEGNHKMASAGMGDALAGILAGTIAYGNDLEKSMVIGTYFHTLAALKIASNKHKVQAMDVVLEVSNIIEEFKQHF